jgi:hypothetical protein
MYPVGIHQEFAKMFWISLASSSVASSIYFIFWSGRSFWMFELLSWILDCINFFDLDVSTLKVGGFLGSQKKPRCHARFPLFTRLWSCIGFRLWYKRISIDQLELYPERQQRWALILSWEKRKGKGKGPPAQLSPLISKYSYESKRLN